MNDVYFNPETRKTHYRRKKNTYGCGRNGWFSGHHGSTHDARKPLPKDETTKGTHNHDWYNMKKYHNRKSRYWFRDQIHNLMRNEKSKL